MRRLIGALLAVGLVLAVLVGLGSMVVGIGDREDGAAGRVASAPASIGSAGGFWASDRPSLAGTLYVLSGPRDPSMNLFEVELATGEWRQLTFNPDGFGVSAFSASRAGLAMATAEGGYDRLKVLGPRRPQALYSGYGSVPSIDDRGRVLISRGTKTGSVIELVEPSGMRRRLVPNDRSDPFAVWGRRGAVLVAGPNERGYGRPTQVTARDAAGKVIRDLGHPGGTFGLLSNPYPGRQPPTGLTAGSRRIGSVFSFDFRRRTAVPRAWDARCWNPAGSELLVTRGATAGLWTPRSPKEVRVIGTLTMRVNECAWMAGPIAGVVPQAGPVPSVTQ